MKHACMHCEQQICYLVFWLLVSVALTSLIELVVFVRERERECVCVCKRERERKGEGAVTTSAEV